LKLITAITANGLYVVSSYLYVVRSAITTTAELVRSGTEVRDMVTTDEVPVLDGEVEQQYYTVGYLFA